MTALSTGESYSYDANGNMTTRVEGGLTYNQTFDAENRLISVTVNGQTTQFLYDGDGNLVKKLQPDGSRTLYVGGIYEVDKNAAGTVTRTVTYYPAAGAMRIKTNTSNDVYYVLKDHLGSASVVADASGEMVGEQRYYPFGETRLTTGSMLTDKLYTGQREMAGLGIYYYKARFYSPYINRFLQPDTIVPNPVNPQTWNRYSYVANNPIRHNDPSGHMMSEDRDGGLGVGGYRYVIEKKFGAKVKGKWSQKEVKTLYDTLDTTLKKFDNNIRAYRNAFDSLTFNMLNDAAAEAYFGDAMGDSILGLGWINLRHDTIPWAEDKSHYGAAGWAIAHEMGYIFDMKQTKGDPNLYFSNVFVELFNKGGVCGNSGPDGCLGPDPGFGYKAKNFFQGIGDYQPAGGRTTPYGYVSSTEDYAESFAAYVTGDPNDYVDSDRETIIQIDIAVMVSYSQ